jgi:hypothetical protein
MDIDVNELWTATLSFVRKHNAILSSFTMFIFNYFFLCAAGQPNGGLQIQHKHKQEVENQMLTKGNNKIIMTSYCS